MNSVLKWWPISAPLQKDNSSLYHKFDLTFEVVAIISIGYNTFVLRVTVAEAAFQSNTSYTVIYYHHYAIMDDSNEILFIVDLYDAVDMVIFICQL